jgi:8-oxo-dGTP pyrophosphatase MutT (NUDIX family)
MSEPRPRAPESELPGEQVLASPFYRVSVKALVFDREDRLLALQNDDGLWELPGGGWEHGETMEEALRREVREELGVEIDRIDSSAIHPCVGRVTDGRYPWLKLAMPVELASHDFTAEAEMQVTSYVTLAQFKTLAMHRSEQCLQDDAESLWKGRVG